MGVAGGDVGGVIMGGRQSSCTSFVGFSVASQRRFVHRSGEVLGELVHELDRGHVILACYTVTKTKRF